MNNFNWDNADYRGQKVYYYNCRLNRQTCLLSGPFLTAAEAEATANVVAPIALNEMPETVKATFGVMECNAPGAGEGRYNQQLPIHLFRNLAIATRLN